MRVAASCALHHDMNGFSRSEIGRNARPAGLLTDDDALQTGALLPSGRRHLGPGLKRKGAVAAPPIDD